MMENTVKQATIASWVTQVLVAAMHFLQTGIGRGVVHDDDFMIDLGRIGGQGFETPLQVGARVVVDDDHGQFDHGYPICFRLHDAGTQGILRNRRAQTIHMASNMIRLFILEVPTWRSVKRMGISLICSPRFQQW